MNEHQTAGLIQKLREDFPPEALSKDTSRGFELTSIKAAYVVERLTDAFGLFGWCYDWKEMGFNDGEWGCIVELRVLVGDDVRTVRQFGGHRMVGNRQADSKKSAVTDGLTKCASMLGIGHSVFKGQQVADVKTPEKPDVPPDRSEKDGKTETLATEPQRKKIYAMSKNIGFEEKEMKELMATRYKVGSSKELTKKQASDFIEFLGEIEEQNKPPD